MAHFLRQVPTREKDSSQGQTIIHKTKKEKEIASRKSGPEIQSSLPFENLCRFMHFLLDHILVNIVLEPRAAAPTIHDAHGRRIRDAGAARCAEERNHTGETREKNVHESGRGEEIAQCGGYGAFSCRGKRAREEQ